MAPLPPVPNCIRSDLLWGIGSDVNALTRLHWTYSGSAPAAADCIYFATQIDSVAAAQFASLLHPANEVRGCIVRDLSSTSGKEGDYFAATPGTRSGGALSAGTAFLLDLQIGRRYRGGKPRAYLPFGTSTDLLSPSAWQSSFVTGVTSAWNTFVSTCGSLTHGSTTLTGLCSVSYYQGFTNVPYGNPTKYRRVPTVRPGGPVVDAIIGTSASTKPSSQRRRNLQRR